MSQEQAKERRCTVVANSLPHYFPMSLHVAFLFNNNAFYFVYTCLNASQSWEASYSYIATERQKQRHCTVVPS